MLKRNEVKQQRKTHSIRFKSMKLEIPIIHSMKYDDKVKCAYTWSMTHIGFNIEHLFQTYGKKTPTSNFVISVQHIGPCNCACKFLIHTNLFMTLTTFTTKMCNVLLVRMRLTHINMQMESTGHFTGWWKRKKKQTKRFSIDLKSDRSKTTSHQKYRKQENSLSFWAWASTKWLK